LERPNGLAFSRRERAARNDIKKHTILRAKRSDCNAVLDGNLWKCVIQKLFFSGFTVDIVVKIAHAIGL